MPILCVHVSEGGRSSEKEEQLHKKGGIERVMKKTLKQGSHIFSDFGNLGILIFPKTANYNFD